MTRHHDLFVSGGETLDHGLRYYTAGGIVRLDQVAVGEWVFYRGEPWPVFAVAATSPTAIRVRLGRGQFWEPDVTAAADTSVIRAGAATFVTVAVDYRTNAGVWTPMPYTLAAADTEVRLLPHTDETRLFTSALSSGAEAGHGTPTSYEWQATATITARAGWTRLAEGALAVIPGQVAAPVPTP